MADAVYNNFKEILMEGGVDFLSDTIKVILVDSTYSPDVDNDIYYSDVTGELSSANGYTAGGFTLSSKSVIQDDSDDEGVFDAGNATWTASGGDITARGAIIYKDSGLASSSPLIGYIDFTYDKTASNGNDFIISWSSEGIINLT